MRNRLQTTMVMALALIACLGERASAHEDHEGTVVKAGDGKLTMTAKARQTHFKTHILKELGQQVLKVFRTERKDSLWSL